MATFTYYPDWGPAPNMTPSRLSAEFGEGYGQRAGKGLNQFLPTWNLTFSKRSQAEALAIYNWFKNNQAHLTAFDWTSPDGTVGKFVADEFTPPYPVSFNQWTTTAKVRQVPA